MPGRPRLSVYVLWRSIVMLFGSGCCGVAGGPEEKAKARRFARDASPTRLHAPRVKWLRSAPLIHIPCTLQSRRLRDKSRALPFYKCHCVTSLANEIHCSSCLYREKFRQSPLPFSWLTSCTLADIPSIEITPNRLTRVSLADYNLLPRMRTCSSDPTTKLTNTLSSPVAIDGASKSGNSSFS